MLLKIRISDNHQEVEEIIIAGIEKWKAVKVESIINKDIIIMISIKGELHLISITAPIGLQIMTIGEYRRIITIKGMIRRGRCHIIIK